MKDNMFIKLLYSLPVILLMLCFIPFLGICLITLRLFIGNGKKNNKALISILVAGILLLIPKGIGLIGNWFNLNVSVIPFMDKVLISSIYDVELMKYSKILISVSIIFIIINYIGKLITSKIKNKVSNGISSYINKTEQRDAKISQENDMKMKIKQEKVKNTHYVKCPFCGSDNLLSDKFGTCEYCRRQIINEDYKS